MQEEIKIGQHVEEDILSRLNALNRQQRRSLVNQLFLTEFKDDLTPTVIEQIKNATGRQPKKEMKLAAETAWNTQRTEALNLLSSFREGSSDPKITEGINNGVLNLMKDLLQWYVVIGYKLTRQPLDLEAAKKLIGSQFESFLPEQMPSNVAIYNGNLQRDQAQRGQLQLMPRSIIFYSKDMVLQME